MSRTRSQQCGVAPLTLGLFYLQIPNRLKLNGTDLRLVGSAHPTVYQHFQRSQFAYVSAIGLKLF
ncbi:MAG: hypothetical protein F6K30_06470 [Cyanothece sp. SIO2G6]|nr:hypothetical protein [Cyanothece sp. SIO2G6]